MNVAVPMNGRVVLAEVAQEAQARLPRNEWSPMRRSPAVVSGKVLGTANRTDELRHLKAV